MCDYYVNMITASTTQYCRNSSEKIITNDPSLSMGVLGELAKLYILKKAYTSRNFQQDMIKVDDVAKEIFQNYSVQLNWLDKLINIVARICHFSTDHTKIETIYLDIVDPTWRYNNSKF